MYWSRAEAGLEQDADLEDTGLDLGMADGAEEHGIELPELFDRAVGQDLAGLQVALAASAFADGSMSEASKEGQPALLSRVECIQHALFAPPRDSACLGHTASGMHQEQAATKRRC